MVEFLPLLLGALGSLAAPVLRSLFGEGLQVDAQQRPYSRKPWGQGLQVEAQQRVKKKKEKKKKKNNNRKKTTAFAINQNPTFDIMNWVK